MGVDREKLLGEALHHLGNALSFGAAIHPDDRNEAYESALRYYNAARPDFQIDAVEYAALRTFDPVFSNRPHHRVRRRYRGGGEGG